MSRHRVPLAVCSRCRGPNDLADFVDELRSLRALFEDFDRDDTPLLALASTDCRGGRELRALLRERDDARAEVTRLEDQLASHPWGSCVYYVTWTGLAVVKIGRTTGLQERLRDFRSWHSSPVQVLVAEPGGRAQEDRRHKQFGHLQAGFRGRETFTLSAELRKHIRELQRQFPRWPEQSGSVMA